MPIGTRHDDREGQQVRSDAGPDVGPRDLRWSWWSLALVPAGFLLGTLTGEGLLALLGYEISSDRVPVGIALLAGIPALTVLLAPPVLAFALGRRAARSGDPRGRLPATLGAVCAAGLVLLNLAAYLWG